VIVMKYDHWRHAVDTELVSTPEYFDRCRRQIDWPTDLELQPRQVSCGALHA
jgi:hypothetical protein